MKDYIAKLYQGGLCVAEASSASRERTEQEIQHYAMMYHQDGPVTIKRNYK